MQIQVVDYTEDDEGWAKITLEMDPEARDAMASEGLRGILYKAIIANSGFELDFSEKD